MTTLKKISILSLIAFFTACTSDIVNGDINTEDPNDTRPTLDIPEGFDFSTKNDVAITISD